MVWTTKQNEPTTETGTPKQTGSPSNDGTASAGADNASINPSDWFVDLCYGASSVADFDESRNDIVSCDESESIVENRGREERSQSGSSVSTLGQVFSGLLSLPSITDKKLPFINRKVDEGIPDVSLSDLSALDSDEKTTNDEEGSTESGTLIWENDTVRTEGTDKTIDSAVVEAEVNKKISQMRLDSELKDDTMSGAELRRVGSRLRREMKRQGMAKNDLSTTKSSGGSNIELRKQAIVKNLRKTVDRYGRYDIRCANITAALGDVFCENNEDDHATQLHEEAVSIYSTKLGDNHVTTMEARLRLGDMYHKIHNYDTALGTYNLVLEMRKALNGDHHASVVDVVVLMARTLHAKGRSTQAIKEMKRALKMYRHSLGDKNPKVAQLVDEIASLYMTTGNYTKAAAILQEVVKLKAATCGINHPDVAHTLMEEAKCYESAGDNQKAMKPLKKAYSIYTSVFGENDEKSIDALEHIAACYKATCNKDKAVSAYLSVLRHRKQTLGPLHPLVADTFLHLGVCLRELENYLKAMKCVKQALVIYIGEGRMHEAADTLHEMALLHKAKNDHSSTMRILKQELAIRRKLGGAELQLAARTLHQMGVAEFDMKNNNRALLYFMEALNVYEEMDVGHGVGFGETLYHTGLVFDAIGQSERASEAYEEAWKIFQLNNMGDEHAIVLSVKSALARTTSRRTI